jgi:hypothetical protein
LRYCRSRVFTFVFFIQKLTEIRSGQNNKSCRIIHNGSNKIGFTFFQFFCDFLRNLQESANSLYYFSCAFAGRPSKRTPVSQCGPWARCSGGSGEIPARDQWIPAGGWWGVFYGPLGFGLGAQLEDRGCWRGCSAAPPVGIRLELASGELSAGTARGRRGATSVG